MQSWIEQEKSRLQEFFAVTPGRWDNLIDRLGRQLGDPKADFYDEVVWTFLLGVGYAAAGWEGIRSLESKVSAYSPDPASRHPLWLEALPMPPRKSEGNTNIDLAIGAIAGRDDKDGGVQFDPELGDSVTFCEMKWYSDISAKVTHDQHRNQLSRVIENAITFQGNGRLVPKVTVTLITPEIFRDTHPKSRLYHYKIEEYRRDPEILLEEWQRSYAQMEKRSQPGWEYPDESHVREMLESGFALRHLSFEQLFREAPETEFSPLMDEFLAAGNAATSRFGREQKS